MDTTGPTGTRPVARRNWGSMPREALLARTVVELADTLDAEFDVVELFALLVQRCVDVLGVAGAGLMTPGPAGDPRVMATSSEEVDVLARFELQSGEGACLDCFRTGQPVTSGDLSVEDSRWPRFAPEALAAGFSSVQALPMGLRGTFIGALSLFNRGPGEMEQADLVAGQALADVATIAVLQHRAMVEAQVLHERLGHALNSRIVIEQAKGMIAERQGLGMQQALSMLRAYAGRHRRGLVDVAHDVIGGALSTSDFGRP